MPRNQKHDFLKKSVLFPLISAMCMFVSYTAAGKGEALDMIPIQKNNSDTVDEYLETLSLEQKVSQLFIITPEALTGVDCVTEAGETTRVMLLQYPVGGFAYFADNLQSQEQVQQMLNNVQKYSIEAVNLPMFTCVDEEGGTVARVGNSGRFQVPYIETMSEVGSSGNTERAYEVGLTIGEYLHELGFNVDCAPVADVLSNSGNTVIGDRSFGADKNMVSQMVLKELAGLEERKVKGVIKHFPGHGSTLDDTHEGYAYTDRTLEELWDNELVPFQEAIDAGVDFIMVGHFAVPNVTGDNLPCSLSPYIVTDLLRNEMGYEGIVMTDALNMGAIVQSFGSAEAAVRALEAGNDLLLMPDDFLEAYTGILQAVKTGRLTEKQINDSAKRIIQAKLKIQELG